MSDALTGAARDADTVRAFLVGYVPNGSRDNDGEWQEVGPREPALAALARLLAAVEAAQAACNICGEPWPSHYEHCAYPANVRELAAERARAETAERERDIAAAAVDYIEQQLFGDTNPVRLMDDVLARIDALAAAEARAVELEGALGDILSHEGHTSTEQCLALIFESVREALVAGVCPPELIGTDEGDRASTQSVTGAGVCPADSSEGGEHEHSKGDGCPFDDE